MATIHLLSYCRHQSTMNSFPSIWLLSQNIIHSEPLAVDKFVSLEHPNLGVLVLPGIEQFIWFIFRLMSSKPGHARNRKIPTKSTNPWRISWQVLVMTTHETGLIMSPMASQITSLTIVYLHVYSKKTSKLRDTGLCEGNSPVTGEFPAQRASTRKMFPFDDVVMSLWGTFWAVELAEVHAVCFILARFVNIRYNNITMSLVSSQNTGNSKVYWTSLFMLISKETSKPPLPALCEGNRNVTRGPFYVNPLVTWEFPSQWAQ